jgi:hypothetical protein
MQLWAFKSHTSTTGSVFTLAGPPQAGTAVQLASNDWAMSQLWQFTHQGYLLSAFNSSLALTGAADGSVSLQPLSAGNAWQVWTVTGEAWTTLTCSGSGNVLTVPPNGGALTLTPPSASGHWRLWAQITKFDDCDYQLTTVTNASSHDLSICLNKDECQGHQSLSSRLTPLPANTSLTFWTRYNGGLASSVQLWDPNYTDGSVASFITHQHNCVLKAGDVWVSDINYIQGYTLGPAKTVEGSYADDLPGLVYMTVSN